MRAKRELMVGVTRSPHRASRGARSSLTESRT